MKEHKIISCAGFGSTGSSVVTDYLCEFQNIHVPYKDDEVRFLYEFGGISTLESIIVDNPSRQNSDYAILLFRRMIKYYAGNRFNHRYNTFLQGRFEELSDKFLSDLIEVSWKGQRELDFLIDSKVETFFKKIWPRIKAIICCDTRNLAKYRPEREMYYSGIGEKDFLGCVSKYMNSIFDVVDPNNSWDFLYFDQLAPCCNISRISRYVNNLRVVVVDRDPRDQYIESVLGYGEKFHPRDIDKFILFYKRLRESAAKDGSQPNVLKVKFEDCVYHYNETFSKINSFLGLDESKHAYPKSKFNPDISINNTQLWKRNEKYEEYTDKIEKELSEYCYQY